MTKTSSLPSLSPKSKAALDAQLAAAVGDPLTPALFWGVTTAEGELYCNCAGDRVHGEPAKGPVTPDTVLQLWSMTKLVTTVACLQLVDRGVLSLDDATLVPKHLPELDAQKILTYTDEDKEVLTPRHSALTLWHLLTHTSGLAYPELNECVGRYAKEHGIASSFTMDTDISPFVVPLLFEPGTRWAYGPRIDWAGSLLERITGQKLSAYFDANIFAPLGITSLTFYPTPDINARELQLCGGDASGALVHAESMRTLDSAKIQIEIGGAGLVGTLRDYIHFLRGNTFPPREDGTSHYDDLEAFVGPWELYDWDAGISYGFCLAVNERQSKFGRSAGSGTWCGIAKTDYWIDPEAGIAAVCGTQILNFVDPDAYRHVYNAFERSVYDLLEKNG